MIIDERHVCSAAEHPLQPHKGVEVRPHPVAVMQLHSKTFQGSWTNQYSQSPHAGTCCLTHRANRSDMCTAFPKGEGCTYIPFKFQYANTCIRLLISIKIQKVTCRPRAAKFYTQISPPNCLTAAEFILQPCSVLLYAQTCHERLYKASRA